LHLKPTDLVDLAREVVAQQQQMTARHMLWLACEGAEIVGLLDAGRIRRVLTNLIANAIKYSPSGGTVDVEVARAVEDGTDWAVVMIRDHGLGIPAQDLGRIFDRFHRGGNVIGRIPGTGIGLASARQIVTQHGGRIEVASVEGEGTTFTVRLPLVNEPIEIDT